MRFLSRADLANRTTHGTVDGMESSPYRPRLTAANLEYLAAAAADAGVSVATALNIIIDEARTSGVSVRAMSGQVIRP